MLRRLLVHNELIKVWNTLVGTEKYIIPATFIVVDDENLLKFYQLYTCTEVRHKNGTIFIAMAHTGLPKMVPNGDGTFRDEKVYGAHIENAELSLNQFTESNCIIAEGKIINRNWVVQYVANSLGGTHFGPNSRKGHNFDSAMAKLKQFDVGEMPASVREILGIGQAICRSNSTSRLMQVYAEWKKENKNVRIA